MNNFTNETEDLIRDYLLNRLSDEETEQFEERLFVDEEFRMHANVIACM